MGFFERESQDLSNGTNVTFQLAKIFYILIFSLRSRASQTGQTWKISHLLCIVQCKKEKKKGNLEVEGSRRTDL